MFNDAVGFKKIFLKVGYTDLRKGIPGLTAMIRESFGYDPYEKNVLFLFCGRKADRIKGLVFEGDGFCLVYKRLSTNSAESGVERAYIETVVFNGPVPKMSLRRSLHSSLNGSWRD